MTLISPRGGLKWQFVVLDFTRGEGNMFTVTLLNAPLIFSTRLCPVPLRWTLRRHLYLVDLALHLCPLDLPGSFLIGVGLLQLASLRVLFLQLLPKLLQQRPQGLQHLPILPKLHGRFRQETNEQKETPKMLIWLTQTHTNTVTAASPFLILMSLVFIWAGVLCFSLKLLG